MKILLAEKRKNHISAVQFALTQIKDSECKEISTILIVDDMNKLDKKLKKEKPDILILDESFISYQTKENINSLKALCPEISILALITSFKQGRKFAEVGVEDFVLKDSADKFYNKMVIFLTNIAVKKK